MRLDACGSAPASRVATASSSPATTAAAPASAAGGRLRPRGRGARPSAASASSASSSALRGRARAPRRAAPHGRPSGSGSSRGGFPRRRGSRGGCRRSRRRPPAATARPASPWRGRCCRRAAACSAISKSKSSTRFPSTTTTRVSSAWVASMSIFFAMISFANAQAAAADAAVRLRSCEGLCGCAPDVPPAAPARDGAAVGMVTSVPARFTAVLLRHGRTIPARPCLSGPRPGWSLCGASACRRMPGSSKTTSAVLQCRERATNTSGSDG